MIHEIATLKSDMDLDKARAIFNFMCPESHEFHFIIIEGEPYSKARPRFTKRGKVYSSQKQKDNENKIGWHLRSHFKQPYLQNLAVGCVFFRSSKQRIDVDNMLKNVMDAANNIVYADDCQVTAKFGMVELDRERPRTVIVVGIHESTMIRDLNKLKVCAHCKKEYDIKSAFYTSRSKYCSRDCSAKGNQKHFLSDANCPCCRTIFTRRTAGQIYCSTRCRNKTIGANKKAKNMKVVYRCLTCGEKVSRPEYVRCRSCWRNDFKKEQST